MPSKIRQLFNVRYLLLIIFGILFLLASSFLFLINKNRDSRTRSDILTFSELSNFNVEISDKKDVESWIPEGAEFGYQVKLVKKELIGDSLRFIEGDVVLGSSSVSTGGKVMLISVYLAPQTLTDIQKADYVLSYLVLKTLSSVRTKEKFIGDRNAELNNYLNRIRESGGKFPFVINDFQNE